MSSDLYCSGLYWAVDVCEVTVMQPEREAESRAQGVRFHHCTICNIAYDFKIQKSVHLSSARQTQKFFVFKCRSLGSAVRRTSKKCQ